MSAEIPVPDHAQILGVTDAADMAAWQWQERGLIYTVAAVRPDLGPLDAGFRTPAGPCPAELAACALEHVGVDLSSAVYSFHAGSDEDLHKLRAALNLMVATLRGTQ